MLGGVTLILAGAVMVYMSVADVTTRELLEGFLDGQLLVRSTPGVPRPEIVGMDATLPPPRPPIVSKDSGPPR